MTRIAVFVRLTSFVALRCSFIGAMLLILIVSSVNAQTVTKSSTDGPRAAGLSPGLSAGTYPLSGFDNINFATGSLNLSLPLLTIGGRGTAQYTMMLSSELHWSVRSQGHYQSCYGSQICFYWDYYYPEGSLGGKVMPGYGPGVMQVRQTGLVTTYCTSGTQGYGVTLTLLTFTMPDGSEIEFRDAAHNGQPLQSSPCGGAAGPSRGTVFVSADGSAMTFISDTAISDNTSLSGPVLSDATGYLLMRDGTRYRIVNGTVRWIRDRNGNQLSFTYDSNMSYGKLIQVNDALGRIVNISYRSPSQAYDDIAFQGSNGTMRHIRIGSDNTPGLRSDYQALTWQQAFPELNGTSQWSGGPASGGRGYVEVPDGRRYYFYSNPYGELARVELPTGGAYEYDWASGLGPTGSGARTDGNGNGGVYRRVVTRRVYDNGGTGNTYTGKITIDRPLGSAFTAVKSYDGQNVMLSHSDHYYYGDPSSYSTDPIHFSGWGDNREYKTDYFATNGTTLLRSVSYTWQPRVTYSWAAADPRLVETVTTLTDTNQVSKRTSINSQTSMASFDQFNNPTDVWEYDYGTGAASAYAKRHTHTDYLTINNGIDYTNYNGAHLRSLARAQQVYSVNPSTGAETVAAQSQTRYDEPGFPLLTYTGVTGWTDPVTTARGNATTTSNWLDQTNTWLETHAQYDQLGNVRKTWDARDTALSNPAQIDYADSFSDGLSRNTFAFPTYVNSPVPDATGQYASSVLFVTSTVYDFSTGLVTSVTDANNKTTSFEYNDSLDRLTKVTLPDGGRTTYIYVDVHQCGPYVKTSTLLDSTGREVNTWQFFDGLGRPYLSQSYENQDPNNQYLRVDTQYDSMGRAWKISSPYRSAGCTSAVNPSGRWTQTTFDALSRPTQATTADGAAVTTAYSGNTVTVTDQAGKKRRSVTDALGRLARVDEPDSSGNLGLASTPAQPTSYYYDALDNLRKVDQGGQQRFFMYDSLGRLIRAKNPEQGNFTADAAAGFPALTDTTSGTSNSDWSIGYLYDANGNLSKRKDARNVTTTYAYDALNRNTTVDYSDTTGINPDVSRFYDGATNGKGRFWYNYGGGNFSTGSNVEHTAIDSYDALGRPLIQRQLFKANGAWGPTYQTSRAYNLAGGVSSQTYPSNHTVTYNYDAAGRLGDKDAQNVAFTGNLGDGVPRTYSGGILYSPFGEISKERYGTDTALYNKLFYNVRGQLAEIRVGTYSTDETWWNRGAILNVYSANPSDGWTASGPDNNGNLRKQMLYIPNDDQISGYIDSAFFYDYDSLNRVYQAREVRGGANQWVQYFNYDLWGNRTIHQTNTWGVGINKKDFTVNTANNRLGVPTGQTGIMSYDAAGNLTTDTYSAAGVTRLYDAENRMTAETQANNYLAGSYSYNADGQRVRRKVNGVETWQVYGFTGELLAEYAANGAPASPQKEYGYRNGRLLITGEPPTGQPPPLNPQNVTWTNVTPTIQVTGNSIQKVSGTSSWYDAGAVSSQAIVAGDGYMEFTPGEINTWRMCGLGNTDTSAYFADIDYAFFVGPSGGLQIYESGNLRGSFGTYAASDRMKVAVEGGVVKYYRNGTLVYTSTVAPTYPLQVDTSLNTVNAGVYSVVITSTTPSSTGTINWLVTDQLGTPRMVFDKTGSLANVKRHDYLPFGEELFAGTGGRTTTQGYTGDTIRQKFTLKERDNETGLDFFEARYHSSVQGRFTSPDPLLASGQPALPQSWNRYTYCVNNPLINIDPSGLWWYLKEGSAQPEWFDNDPGKGYTQMTQFTYWGGEENGYVALDPYSNNWQIGFDSQSEATGYSDQLAAETMLARDPGQYVSQLDGTLEVATYISGIQGVVRIGAAAGERLLAREASTLLTETTTQATIHGGARLAARGFTEADIAITKTGTQLLQRDGATVFLKEVTPGKFNVIVEGGRGVVTALKNISEKSVARLSQNYGWFSPIK